MSEWIEGGCVGNKPRKPKDEWTAYAWALGEIENRVLAMVDGHITGLGWCVDTLIFDGLMVRRREGVDITATDLRFAEAAVKAECGIDITLAEKQLCADLVAAKWLAVARFEADRTVNAATE